ncbi:MAG: hypothetical protein ABFD57_08015 [Smithella sp.]
MNLENKIFSKNISKGADISILLAAAEDDVKKGRTKNARTFLKEFKQRVKIHNRQ